MDVINTEQITGIVSKLSWLDAVKIVGIAVLGAIAIRLLMKGGDKLSKARGYDSVWHMFLRGIVKVALWVILLLIIAGTVGIDMTSLVALFGVLALSVSLAAQGILGNIAAGFQIMTVHPFSTGDYVEIGSRGGTVTDMGLMSTTLKTPDGFKVVLPNSSIASAEIVNYTVLGTRRLDVVIGVSYDADPDTVISTLLPLAQNAPAALPDPAPQVLLTSYSDSAIEYTIRLWTKTGDYWTTRFQLQHDIWQTLKDAGINIPYPQMDVHIAH